jgi:phage repressor protein C with HTH and peptisase S24 domain
MNSSNVNQVFETSELNQLTILTRQRSNRYERVPDSNYSNEQSGSKKRESLFPLCGNSMSPVYQPGEMMLCREFDTWREFLPFGEAFLVITNGFSTVKYVKRGKDENTLLMVSANRNFEDFEMPKNLILKMFLITGSITRNIL